MRHLRGRRDRALDVQVLQRPLSTLLFRCCVLAGVCSCIIFAQLTYLILKRSWGDDWSVAVGQALIDQHTLHTILALSYWIWYDESHHVGSFAESLITGHLTHGKAYANSSDSPDLLGVSQNLPAC